jgi:hypothetical protein
MSLAMFAAPFDDNSNITLPTNSENSDVLNQKRHKRTQRKYPKIENFDNNKVNSVLQKLHESTNDDDDEDNDMNKIDFNPPPKPQSAGVEKTIPKTESFNGMFGKTPMPTYGQNDDLALNDYTNYGDAKSNEEYYRRVIPGYNNQPSKGGVRHSMEPASSDVLMQKLNYMISLLEDQQDERTSNVTEEVILYSFLGIFIIFIADTFVRAGKYVR